MTGTITIGGGNKQFGRTIDERIKEAQEQFASWADRHPHYIRKGLPFDPRNNVVAVLARKEGRKDIVKKWIFGANIVTNDGDIYYAKKACGESPASNENFLQARAELRTGSATPAKGDTYTNVTTPVTASRKTITSTYPKTNDTGDADNTGDAVDAASYAYSWTTSDFNATAIIGGALHDNASPVNATKLLTHFSITSFDKTASDTLKLFVNHTMNGV